MGIKKVVDFDVFGYRNYLIHKRDVYHKEYMLNKGTLAGMSYESMRNALDIALDGMERYVTFE